MTNFDERVFEIRRDERRISLVLRHSPLIVLLDDDRPPLPHSDRHRI